MQAAAGNTCTSFKEPEAASVLCSQHQLRWDFTAPSAFTCTCKAFGLLWLEITNQQVKTSKDKYFFHCIQQPSVSHVVRNTWSVEGSVLVHTERAGNWFWMGQTRLQSRLRSVKPQHPPSSELWGTKTSVKQECSFSYPMPTARFPLLPALSPLCCGSALPPCPRTGLGLLHTFLWDSGAEEKFQPQPPLPAPAGRSAGVVSPSPHPQQIFLSQFPGQKFFHCMGSILESH